MDVGGAERCLTNLACGLARHNFDCQVYALASRPQIDDLALQLEQHEVPVRFLGIESRRQVLRATRLLKQQLNEQRPQLVQSFMFHANVIAQMAVARISPPTRPTLIGGLRVADPSRCRMILERRACKRMQHVVCVSQSVAGFAEKRLGLPQNKIGVIANGIDVTRFKLPASGQARTLLFVGRLHKQKGLDWFIPLLPDLFAKHEDLEFHLVGEGPQRDELEGLVQQLGLSDRVRFLGWRRDADQLIASSETVVLPSRWEGMPNVLLEAMAARKPVVACTAEGVNELLGPLADSQTVPFGASDSMSTLLSKICSSSEQRDELARENRRRVEQHFSLESVIAQYAETYRRQLQ